MNPSIPTQHSVVHHALLAMIALILVAVPVVAGATGFVADSFTAVQPYSSAAYPAELLRLYKVDVDVVIDAGIATVTETRSYAPENFDGKYNEKATFVFHRSLVGQDNPSVDCKWSSFMINGTTYAGSVLEPEAADAYRRELIARLHDPAPLREMGSSLFVSEPIELQYSPYLDFQIEIVLTQPLTSSGTMEGIAAPVDWHRAPVSIQLDVTAHTEAPLRALYAPYHKLSVSRVDDHTLVGTYSGYDRCTSFDVTVLLSTGDEPFHLDILPYRYGDAEGGFFMALISPESTPPSDAVVARDIVFLVDHSGSMDGQKMEQAKDALNSVLAGLREGDSFAIVGFDDKIGSFLDAAVPASSSNVGAAQAFVNELKADGSTNIYDALLAGFSSLPQDSDHARYIVLLTDGQPTAGETDTDAIANMAQMHNELGVRIFTFGIGYDVNTLLLDRLAMDSAGDAIYINNGQPVDEAVQSFFERIADPVLAHPVLDISDFGGSNSYPEVLDDIYAGQTAVVVGRYSQPGDGQIILQGQRGGQTVYYTYQATLPAFNVDHGFASRVWATRHVGKLLQDVKMGNSDPAIVDEAVTIARRFGVVTEFTYFLVDEAGDAKMTYSDVPVDAVGQVAVSTSSSIDSYQKGGTLDAPVDTYVRYAWDRTLPVVSNWFTDTSLPAEPAWIDIHFGSEQYMALAENEASLGIGGFLSVDTNVKFELFGRQFRVSDPAPYQTAEIPEEDSYTPTAVGPSESTSTEVAYLGTIDPGSEPEETEIAGVTGVNITVTLDADQPSNAELGCSSTPSGRPPAAIIVLLMAMGLLGAARRKTSV